MADAGCQVGIDRRSLLRFGAQMLAIASAGGAIGLMSGCSTEAPDVRRHGALVTAIADALIPATTIAGAGDPGNVAFVLNAIDAELMKVPRDLIDQLVADMRERGMPDLLHITLGEVREQIAALDSAVMRMGEPRAHPWFALKALIVMSYFTSEAGMTQVLRYDLAPGRYDNDVLIDASWRPLSNDWSAVAVKRPIRP
jgi:hypothetical protein